MLSYRHRRLLVSSLKRSLRWEFWPMWLFYIPVAFYIIYLVCRYRSLSFTAVNPGMDGSGFVCHQKSQGLLQLQALKPEHVAATRLLSCQVSLLQRVILCREFMDTKQLSYPIIAKPDSGQRGVDVAIINNEEQLKQYLSQAKADTILQEYVEGIEIGVFYYRFPTQQQGHIFSLTYKNFPYVVGNGKDTLEVLILNHSRLHYMARFLLGQYDRDLSRIPDAGEKVEVVRLGSHCRGSLFLEGESYRTERMEYEVDQLSQSLTGFFFGRYDIRAKDIESFQQGMFKIIEINGVTSESTNMYDPQYSIVTAYKILFKQWRLAFEVGQQNILQGHMSMSLLDLIAQLRLLNKGSSIELS